MITAKDLPLSDDYQPNEIDLKFFSKIKSSKTCWEWLGGKNSQGYGYINVRGKMVSAHRYMYQLTKGLIKKGNHVRHSCHNQPCVNPAHLSQGTPTENSQDSVRDKQMFQGINNPAAKLSEDQVREIRKRRLAGENGYDLAREFAIHNCAVYEIASGKRWASVK